MKFVTFREGGGDRHDARGLVIYYSGDLRASMRLGISVHQPRNHAVGGWLPFDNQVGKSVALNRWAKSPLVIQLVGGSAEETPRLTPRYALRIAKMILMELPVMTWERSEEIPLIPNPRDVSWKSRCFGPDGESMLEISTQGRSMRFVGQVPPGKNMRQYVQPMHPHPWLRLFPSWVPEFAESI